LAAGITWTLMIASAPWAGRFGHTSVIDAAGAIYVIGGDGDSDAGLTDYHDVWVSTDGGAGPDSVLGIVGGGTTGVTQGLLGRYSGALSSRAGSSGVLEGDARGNALYGYSGEHTPGASRVSAR
jgi:hypothetical protein